MHPFLGNAAPARAQATTAIRLFVPSELRRRGNWLSHGQSLRVTVLGTSLATVGLRCPRCNGQHNRALREDEFECTSNVVVGEKLVGIVPPNPYQPFEIPVFDPVYGACGHRFTGQQGRERAQINAAQAVAERADRVRVEEARRREQARAEKRWQMEAEVSAAVDARLPALPHPTSPGARRPTLDFYSLAGLIAYGLVGSLILWGVLAMKAAPAPLPLAGVIGTAALAPFLVQWWRQNPGARAKHAVALEAFERATREAAERHRAREQLRDSLAANRLRMD